MIKVSTFMKKMATRKKKKKNFSEKILIKLSIVEKNRAQGFADIYAGGNLSKWVRHCLDNYSPKFLKKKRPPVYHP